MSKHKYQLPEFLKGDCEQAKYSRWLHRKAQAHVIRDRERNHQTYTVSAYKERIHAAVVAGGDRDFYTGEALDWKLISKFENEKAKKGRTEYKKQFWHLPTVDHTFDEKGEPRFVICSWKTNDSKSDLLLEEFHALCDTVLSHRNSKLSADREVQMPSTTRKEFVARTTYHHSQRTSEHVTLLAYKDSNEAYELLDDREPLLDFLAGSKDYIFEEWGKRNRELIKDGFQRDNMSGDNDWQRFIS